MAQYNHHSEPVEEYIDLNAILEDLYMEAESFLDPVKEVRVAYD